VKPPPEFPQIIAVKADAGTAKLVGEDGFALEFLELAKHSTCKVPARFYRMMNPAGEHIGNINLRLQSTPHVVRYAGHIGYDVHPEHRGHHYAAQAVRLLIPVAQQHRIDPVWITCDPENTASRRSCELAGAEYVETVAVLARNAIFLPGHPRKCRYRLDTGCNESNPVAIPSEQP
jgi:RimJ/RimL family protein N-acetyltransferase